MDAPNPRPADGPNAEHIAVWDRILVPKSTRFRRVLVGAGRAHSRLALAAHPVGTGERVLDVGCGFGETAIDLALRVGPTGRVVGADCCQAFLDVATTDAAGAQVRNVRFVCGDAQIDRFVDGADLCFSQFGTMFFANPVAALRNLRSQLGPGGRLLMLTWRRVGDNPWLGGALDVVRQILPPLPEDAASCGPGPFSMADADTITAICDAAGFRDLALTQLDCDVDIGATLDDAVQFQLELGPAGQLVREAGEAGQRRRPELVAAIGHRLRPHVRDGGVWLGSSSWCVSARV